MKNSILTLVLLLVGGSLFHENKLLAQPLPVEISATHRAVWYQQLISRKMSKNSAWGFFSVSSWQKSYDIGSKAELMTQSYLSYQVHARVTITAGVHYTHVTDWRPSLAVQLNKKWKHAWILLVPRTDIWRIPAFELMALYEYRPPITENIGLYSRIQIMSSVGASSHNRSYQHLRIGLDFKHFQTGLSLHLDEYGDNLIPVKSYGIFFRKEIGHE